MGASSSTSLVQDNGSPFITDDPHLTILNEEMSRRHIDRSDIPSRFTSSTVRLRGHGRAKCPSCSREWTSHQASAKIDLENLTIKVWRQKCKNCYYIVQMTFKEKEFRRMVNNMLDRHDRLKRQMRGKHSLSVNHDDATSEGHGPPHCKDLCEGCDWGAGDCRATSSASGGTSDHAKSHAAVAAYDDATSEGRGPPHRKDLCEGCVRGAGVCRATSSALGGTSDHAKSHAAVAAYVGNNTTGRGGNRSWGESSGGDDSSDSSRGLKIFGAVALGVGLLAAGGLAAYALSKSNEEEEEKKRGEKK